MRILLDLQGCQSLSSKNRGIGRYSMSLALAITRVAPQNEYWLLLNASFPESIEEISLAFELAVPAQRVITFNSLGVSGEVVYNGSLMAEASEAIREMIIERISPDVVHVSSLFEGSYDACVVSIPKESCIVHAVTLYDLIPLLHADRYLENKAVKSWYLRKVKLLERADLLLGISESACQEAQSVGIAEHSEIINISSAVDRKFFSMNEGLDDHTRMLTYFGISRPFVMYTGGIDWRKNIEGLIEAYSTLPNLVRDSHQLVLVCQIENEARANLLNLSYRCGLRKDDIVMTGYVSDQNLRALYQNCRLFVFPSLHEGFGLPALEAISCGVAVIGSNTSSIPEVIGRIDALFDPHDPQDMGRLILKGLVDEVWRLDLIRHASSQAAKFSWEYSAKKTLDAFSSVVDRKRPFFKSKLSPSPTICSAKKKLAIVTPMPPLKSGIANYCAELIPALCKYYDVVAICDQPSDANWDCQITMGAIKSVRWFEDNAHKFDRIVYQFGNSEHHAHMFDLLLRFPGVVVLHDFFLSGVLAWMQYTNFSENALINSIARSHGRQGVKYLQKHGLWEAVEAYPANSFVLDRALGIIVHSKYSMELAKKFYGQVGFRKNKWAYIALLRSLPHDEDKIQARKDLGIKDDEILVCSFGFISASKFSDLLIEAWVASSLGANKKCKLVLVGQNPQGNYGHKLEEIISRSPCKDNIVITDFVERSIYQKYLRAADIGVQLRGLSRGESSMAVLDCLAHKVPVLLNANGAMAEYPKEAVYQIPDRFSQEQLINALEDLVNNEELRHSIGMLGEALIKESHRPEIIAEQYEQEIERFYSMEPELQEEYWETLIAISSTLGNYKDSRELILLSQALSRTLTT